MNGESHLTREITQVPLQTAGEDSIMPDIEATTVNSTPHAVTIEGNVAAPASTAPQSLYTRRAQTGLDQGEMRLPDANTQYLRPITPTEPLMGDENAMGVNVDILVREGPTTPTNTAGPFLCS